MSFPNTTSLVFELPDIIVTQIVHLAARPIRPDHTSHPRAPRQPTYPLLSYLNVCQQWRRAILPHFYSRACLCACRHSLSNLHQVLALHNIVNVTKLGYAGYVRRLAICLSRDITAEGTILGKLKTMPAPGILPGVLEITLLLDGPSWDARIASDKLKAAVVDKFVRGIKNCMPNVNSVVVGTKGRLRHSPVNDLPYLVQSLLSGTHELMLTAPPFILRRLASWNWNTVADGLSGISVGRKVLWSDNLTKFIRRHALTLQTLKLESVSVDMFHRLLCGDRTESQHIYPNISQLELSTSTFSVSRQYSYNLPPFPALTHYINQHSYPFSDDTILRCNSQRLEVIKLPLSLAQFERIHAQKAFCQGKYAKLTEITMSLDGVLSTPGPDNAPNKFFVSVCSMSAKAEKIHVDMGNTDITLSLIKLKQLPTVQKFVSPRLRLRALDLLSLLAKFPGISYVGFSLAECASNAEYTPLSDEEIQSDWQQYSSKSHICTMELFDTGHTCGLQCTSQSIIHLASLLPNLREITVRPHTKLHPRMAFRQLVQEQQHQVYKQRPHVNQLKITVLARYLRFSS